MSTDTVHSHRLALARIQKRVAKIGIFGMGYVGLPLALRFSEERFLVTGFETDLSKVEMLNNAESYIAHISDEAIADATRCGFCATGDMSSVGDMDVILICVPTPLSELHQPDLSFIEQTARSIAPYLKPGSLIILESTTYPGTTEEVLIPLLEAGSSLGLKAVKSDGDGLYVAFSPEREDPGNHTVDRRDIPKVIGSYGVSAGVLAAALYQTIFKEIVPVSNPAVAEMTKLLENTYRCVNIAMINELKQLCKLMNIDVFEVIEAAKSKPFGFQPFYPGPGLGGHCIPIDPFYLSWKAKQFGFRTRFIELAGEINEGMPHYVVEQTIDALNQRKKPVKGSFVLVLGVAYKRDVDDLRESPSLAIIDLLRSRGAEVSYNDPFFPFVGTIQHRQLNMTCASLKDLSRYDCVIIATDHTIYDYAQIVQDGQLIIDTRNATKGLVNPKIVRC